ncbi:DUF4160 domain-containing protein [Mesorhizobium sp. LHD-90]|uniref:DUF4160 domain-containing protein n=1 Tax=Mesorhizobium sp. LHD-90 TaxID=3071414 RepID=UPI0027E1629A|nr:DUF4160 domain-containing protein [Mesorhizobium sp. LHD-90]MDQ6435447.1 DUF4160 domain-containing protein [Mesorhizobium sp. LHD-90]
MKSNARRLSPQGLSFHFFSNEGYPREPAHVHVTEDGIDAKFWLWPDVVVAYNDGFSARTLRELTEVITNRRAEIANVWNEFFGEGD